jgi:predicted TIM-barrel enzyme
LAVRYTRAECLAGLRAEIDKGRGLVMTGAGNGIAAKFIERGGVDLIGVYNTGYFRMQGYGSLAGMLPILDANELVYRTAEREVLPQVSTTRSVVGVNGVDPCGTCAASWRISPDPGSAACTFPTVAWFEGDFRRTLEATGLGYEHELTMLKIARDLDACSRSATPSAKTIRGVLCARPCHDILIFHAGITAGGATGDRRLVSATHRRAERAHFAP